MIQGEILKSNLIIKIIGFLLLTTSITLFAKININSASKTELQKLSRIGPKKAERIIKYRLEHGDFKRVEDLAKVKGIGKKTVENLRADIEVISKVVLNNEEDNPEGKININLAEIDEFSMMPGIGATKKKKIIEYREKNGYFKTKEEIMNVKGIGEKIFEKISVFITIKIDINTIDTKELRKLKGLDPSFINIIEIYRNNKKKITVKLLESLLKKYKMEKFKNCFWIKS